MKRPLTLLAGLLLLQTALAGALIATGDDYGAFEAREPLIAFDVESANRVAIADGEREVVLERSGAGWALPGLDGFPADADKVDRLLEGLAALKRGWPVAQNRASAERFKVADDVFERRIEITESDEKAVFFIGDAPAFDRAYARSGGDNDVFNVDFSAFDAPADPDDWTDRGALHADPEEVAEILIGDIRLAAGDDDGAADGFRLANLADGETMNAAEVEAAANAALSPPFDTVLRTEDAPAGPETDGLVITITKKDGGKETLRFWPDGDDAEAASDYFLRSSAFPQTLKVAKYRVKRLLSLERSSLVDAPTPAPSPDDPARTDGAAPKSPGETTEGLRVQEAVPGEAGSAPGGGESETPTGAPGDAAPEDDALLD